MSVGRGCASRLSVRFLRRRRRRARYTGRCSNWRRANGVTEHRRAGPLRCFHPGTLVSTAPATSSIDPVAVLRRKRRGDAGAQASMTPALRRALLEQYGAHKSWSAQLHHDNLVALAETRPQLRPVPSYTTLRRFLAASGLTRRRATTTRQTDGTLAAAARLEAREVRGFEAEYVNGLWHWDCHHGSRKVLTSRGESRTPILFGVLDDRSRLACHLQWYLAESAENIAHGLSQAMQKRGLPRAAMSDNGSAMTATEITEGLARLGIVHQTTLPYSPYQNGSRRFSGDRSKAG